jgi:molybdopterin converting factor small subunit
MQVSVHLTTALRSESGGRSELSVCASTVREALEELKQNHAAVYRSVCDETGAVRRHIHLFVNASMVNFPQDLDLVLRSEDVLSIMTAVSGG